MNIIDVVPKDIYVTFELPYSEVKKLLVSLNMARIDYDGNDPEQLASVEFLTDVFYKKLEEVSEAIENGS